MSSSAVAESPRSERPFGHEAFFYAGESQFLEGTSDFVRGAVAAREPILVVVSARKIDLLRDRLKADAAKVRFADMADVGVNPARIIPAWADFVQEHGGRPVRGIGEPIWAERTPAEIAECQRHESLLNVAFAGSADFHLMCPYDTATLDRDVLDEAGHSHPVVCRGDTRSVSPRYPGVHELAQPMTGVLPDPPDSAVDLAFGVGALGDVRALVRQQAMNAGMGPCESDDVVIAVNEVASNSLCHAGGRGVLRVWHAGDTFVCEVSDEGCITEPLVGRVRPEADARGGRGLWIVNQLCELVQVRSTPTGTTVRMHLRRHPWP